MLIKDRKNINEKNDNFFILNDLDLINKLNNTDKLLKEWKINFKSFNESFNDLSNKLWITK